MLSKIDVQATLRETLGVEETTKPSDQRPQVPPASKHQLALMIPLCVFPTLTVVNVAFGDRLRTMSPVTRRFFLATIAVPIVIYGLMPCSHRLRARLLNARATQSRRRASARDQRPTVMQRCG